jgi:hypothetical protein
LDQDKYVLLAIPSRVQAAENDLLTAQLSGTILIFSSNERRFRVLRLISITTCWVIAPGFPDLSLISTSWRLR